MSSVLHVYHVAHQLGRTPPLELPTMSCFDEKLFVRTPLLLYCRYKERKVLFFLKKYTIIILIEMTFSKKD